MLECLLTPADFDTELVQQFKQSTEDKLRGVRCPDHRQNPRLQFRGTRLRDITISLGGCCDKLMELANRAIAEAPAVLTRRAS